MSTKRIQRIFRGVHFSFPSLLSKPRTRMSSRRYPRDGYMIVIRLATAGGGDGGKVG